MAQKYGWFSPVKGAYPGMGQEDKTAELVVSDAETVCRGMVLELNADGKFEVAASFAAGKDLYFCLQDGTDTQAEFAGGTWYGDSKVFKGPFVRGADTLATPKVLQNTVNGSGERVTGPAVSGISVYQSGEYQTNAFDDAKDYALGAKLYVQDGILTTESNGTEIAIVTKAKFSRYLNDKPTHSGRNQGAMGDVIQFRVIA